MDQPEPSEASTTTALPSEMTKVDNEGDPGISRPFQLVMTNEGDPGISLPFQMTNNIHITFNKETRLYEGVPEPIRKSFEKAIPPLNVDVSQPFLGTHHVSIRFNETTGQFEGIPEEIEKAILKAGYTIEQVLQNPSLVQDLLYELPIEQVLKNAVVHEISAPVSATHHISVHIGKDGQFEGVPQPCLDALKGAGFDTVEQVMSNVDKASEVLYHLPLQEVLDKDSPTAASITTGVVNISHPTKVAHHFSIKFNHQTGKYEGIPQVILDELAKQGKTLDMVQQDPLLMKDLLYSLDFFQVAGAGKNLRIVPSHHVEKPSTLKVPTAKGEKTDDSEFQQIRHLLPKQPKDLQPKDAPKGDANVAQQEKGANGFLYAAAVGVAAVMIGFLAWKQFSKNE